MTIAKPAGPHVFLDYDQAALDAAYDQARWCTNQAALSVRNNVASDAARTRMPPAQRIAYGPGPMEHLDLFRAQRTKAPVFVFVHGGAWRANSSARHAYIVEAYVDAGAHAVLLDFDGVETLGGNLLAVIDQVRRGVAWVAANAASFGGDPARIHIAGHSSGAHLTGCVLVTDWAGYGLPDDVLAGALVCSGMYELEPVALSARRSYVNFDAETVAALSSQRHLARIAMPVIVAYASEESPEFQRQSREFSAALEAAGKPVQLLLGEGYNHFEMTEALANPYGLLGCAMFAQMGLRPATGFTR
jgi:arylformamidase